jgi:ubiquitin carboxyl-terminal hydrolase 4/11/15
LASRHEPFNSFLKRVKLLVGITMKTRVRVWRILGGLGESIQTGIITPAQSRSVSPAPAAATVVDAGNRSVLELQTFVSLQLGSEREALEARDETANEKYNGHSSIGIAGLTRNEVLLLEEQIGARWW